MVLSLNEIIDLIIMSAALGYIFMDSFRRPDADPWELSTQSGFSWHDFWYAIVVVAPSIILHEMAHKFVALNFGLNATFHAHIPFLALGVFLKMINFGFIFFVPGYVSIMGAATALESFLIAFSGPFMHLVLWFGSKQYLKSASLSRGQNHFWVLVMKINGFLFLLNILPIPGFDGWTVWTGLFNILTSIIGF